MKKKERNQVVTLVLLLVIWAVFWRLFIKVPRTVTARAAATKTVQVDSPLKTRFRKVRSEMDALYHYRIKPTAFDAQWNAFRIPAGMGISGDQATPGGENAPKKPVTDAPPLEPLSPDYSRKLLNGAVASMRIGGVVTLNGITQLTVNGQLHREGDEFVAKVALANGPVRSVLIRIKHLSTASVTLAIEDANAGGAEIRVRLN